MVTATFVYEIPICFVQKVRSYTFETTAAAVGYTLLCLYARALYYTLRLALTRFIRGPSAVASGVEGSELIRQFRGSPGGVIYIGDGVR